MTLKPMTVKWISGAEASISGLQACSTNGNKQEFRFARPTGVEGLEIDVQYAGQLQQIAILQQQLALQQSVAQQQYLYQLQQTFAAQQASWAQIRAQTQQRLRSVSCTSNVVGSFVYTNCQ